MKRVAILGCAWILAAGLAAAEVKVVDMDAAAGASEGHWVVFVSRPNGEDARTGSAVAAEGNGKAFGSAFGLVNVDAKQAAAPVKQDQYKKLTDAEGAGSPTVIKVAVTAEQHKKVKDLIAKYTKKEQEVSANNVTLNFAQEVISAIGFKRPYRSGISGTMSVQYIGDIPRYNRKQVKGS